MDDGKPPNYTPLSSMDDGKPPAPIPVAMSSMDDGKPAATKQPSAMKGMQLPYVPSGAPETTVSRLQTLQAFVLPYAVFLCDETAKDLDRQASFSCAAVADRKSHEASPAAIIAAAAVAALRLL
jgi:hypothetical protein